MTEGRRLVHHAKIRRLKREARDIEYYLALGAISSGSVGSAIVVMVTGMPLELGGLLSCLGMIGLLAALHIFYSTVRPAPRLANATGCVSLMFAAALTAGIIAHVGLRIRFPYVDQSLADADRALGTDTPKLVLAFAGRPYVNGLLQIAYVSIFPMSFLIALVLGLNLQTRRMWGLVYGFCSGIQISAVTSIFLPALGSFYHSGLNGLSRRGFPASAGVFHLSSVNYFRDNPNAVVDIRFFNGIVTFPSFHVIMAIAAAFACRSFGPVGWLICAWCGLVAVSTVPIGGHYVVDLLAGVLVWVLCMAVARLNRPSIAARTVTAA